MQCPARPPRPHRQLPPQARVLGLQAGVQGREWVQCPRRCLWASQWLHLPAARRGHLGWVPHWGALQSHEAAICHLIPVPSSEGRGGGGLSRSPAARRWLQGVAPGLHPPAPVFTGVLGGASAEQDQDQQNHSSIFGAFWTPAIPAPNPCAWS